MPFDIRLVFDDYRNAVQRTDRAGSFISGVESVGFLERVRV